ncbi:MAG: DUF3352 domain-containing protein [Armatimonadetes bacterium]|nr:DUF3352 domain-containing protein [Armatimonadota bacterium]
MHTLPFVQGLKALPLVGALLAGFMLGPGGVMAAPRPAAPPRTVPPVPKAAATPRPDLPAAARSVLVSLPGMRYLPQQPLLVAAVQVNAVDNFLKMLTGNVPRQASQTDMMTGALQLLKDQIDGPVSVGLYPDATGKSFSLMMAARLKESGFTRELLNGFVTLGGDEKNAPQRVAYKGQTLISMELPKRPAGTLPIHLQPTFAVTTTDYLLIGTSLPIVKQSVDVGAQAGTGLGLSPGVTAMLQEVPITSATDVWLYVPKPPADLKGVRTPIPVPLANLPLGATVATLRFTSTGVRFEGLASVDRNRAAQTPRAPVK